MKTAEARLDRHTDYALEGHQSQLEPHLPGDGLAGATLIEGARQAFWIPTADEEKRRRYIASVSFHVLLIGSIYAASLHLAPLPAQEQPVELVMEQPAPPAPAAPPIKAEEPPPPPPAPKEEAIATVKPKPVKPKPPKVVKKEVTQPTAANPLASQQAAQTATPATPAAVPPKGLPSAYVARVIERVSHSASGNYPRAALARDLEGRVAYKLVLGADGALIRYSVEPSGKEIFDRAAAEAIEKAAPYPTPPSLGANAYEIGGVIAYQLTDE